MRVTRFSPEGEPDRVRKTLCRARAEAACCKLIKRGRALEVSACCGFFKSVTSDSARRPGKLLATSQKVNRTPIVYGCNPSRIGRSRLAGLAGRLWLHAFVFGARGARG